MDLSGSDGTDMLCPNVPLALLGLKLEKAGIDLIRTTVDQGVAE